MSGVRALAYIVVQGPVEEWKSFGTDLLGAQAARHTADEIRLRTDERAWRIAVEGRPRGRASLPGGARLRGGKPGRAGRAG